MKSILLFALIFTIISCSDDDSSCFENWKYSEWCETPTNCDIVGCQTPTNGQRRFECSEVSGVEPGDTVEVRTDGCVTFYRRYIEKID